MFKEIFIEKILELADGNDKLRILDLGSGTSEAIVPALKKYPNLEYCGIEPNPRSAETARENLKPFKNARIIESLAYSLPSEEKFDVCISISACEHIKSLDKFLQLSVDSVKKGGLIVHSYDLGHALFPSSLKEKFQIFLGNKFPFILPESKFVSYIDEEKFCSTLKSLGAEIFKITRHQMPDHKSFLKALSSNSSEEKELIREMVEWEFKASNFSNNLGKKIRERLFPAIRIWARKI